MGAVWVSCRKPLFEEAGIRILWGEDFGQLGAGKASLRGRIKIAIVI